MNTSFPLGSQLTPPSQLADPQAYTDLANLEKIKQQAQNDGEGALREVARQFESIFLNIVLKSMRGANEAFAEDGFFNSQQSKIYRDMYDQQISLSMTAGSGLGLADMLVKQLGRFVDRGQASDAQQGEAGKSEISAEQQRGLQAYRQLAR